MQETSLYDFIVYTDKRYNNEVSIGDNKLIVNTDISVKDYMFTNRVAKVKSLPKAYDTQIKIGDDIIVHHNVFRRWYDVKGVEQEASGFLRDNHFLVKHDEIFGYRSEGGEWKAMEGFVFIKPVGPESIWNTSGESVLKGQLIYCPDSLEHLRGHVVGFTPESEYEFNIDGERIYRVYAHHITIDYGSETKEKENNQLVAESS